ncbi:MAG: tetratricopeptide repeat protein [Elusimicrobiota bacterium]
MESPESVYAGAVRSWLDGRPDDAVEGFKYAAFMSSGTPLAAAAMRDAAVLLAEAGRPQEALAWLERAGISSEEDPHAWYEKGWDLLAVEDHAGARRALERALTLTADQDLLAHARFALAMAEEGLRGPSEAIELYRGIYQSYPYLLVPAAVRISRNFELLKKRQHSVTFLKEALLYDPRNFQAAIDLARVYEKVDYHVPAWQTYYTLAEIDPREKFFSKKKERLSKQAKGDHRNLFYWTRMAWPVHTNPVKLDRGDEADIALFAGDDGVPATVRSFSFICNTPFTIEDSRLGRTAEGPAGSQWTAAYNPFNRIYEVKDTVANAVYSTRNTFRLVPRTPGGVILIKNADVAADGGVNRGDREVTGELLVNLRREGFVLINRVPLENVLPAMTARASEGDRNPESLKALSVVLRTRLRGLKASMRHSRDGFHLCDSHHCQRFDGINTETGEAADASASTRGQVISGAGLPQAGEYTPSCGGFTESGVSDLNPLPKDLTPFSLSRHLHRGPPDNMYCLPPDKAYASDAAWTLMLEPRWIEDRANRTRKIGRLRNIRTLGRSPSGKVLSIRLEGTAGSAEIKGFKEISEILSAGTLRSPLFTLRPLFKGKFPSMFFVKGLGTGEGRGYCVAGAKGLAGGLGWKYREILRHYFPGLTVTGTAGNR